MGEYDAYTPDRVSIEVLRCCKGFLMCYGEPDCSSNQSSRSNKSKDSLDNSVCHMLVVS